MELENQIEKGLESKVEKKENKISDICIYLKDCENSRDYKGYEEKVCLTSEHYQCYFYGLFKEKWS